MRKQLYISLLAAILALPLLTRAEEVVVSDTIEAVIDSIVVAEDSVPDWYVAPEIPEALRSPMRATASGCLTDSILTFNADSVLTEVTICDYDAAGRTIRTTIWNYDSTGILSTSSKTEYGFDPQGSQVYTAIFAWDATMNDWQGSFKSEYVYNEAHKMESNISYIWANNAWLPSDVSTYAYDNANREIEYTTYVRSSAQNKLVPSQRLVREYNSVGKKVLEEIYGSYTNDAWFGTSKKIYDFDSQGNQVLYVYYSSMNSNYQWVGSTREIWEYDSKKNKILYEKYTWQNSTWLNNTKEVYTYNASKKVTSKIVFTGEGNNWIESTKEITNYDSANHTILSAKYKWMNGNWIGVGDRTETTYTTSGSVSATRVSSWNNTLGDWLYSSRRAYQYDSMGRVVGDTVQHFVESIWTNYSLVTHIYDDKNNDILKTTSGWNGIEWVAVSKDSSIYIYTSTGKLLLMEMYTGLGNSWIGNQKMEYTYNDVGSQTMFLLYEWNSGTWVYKTREIQNYDASNRRILSQSQKWQNNAWIGNYKYEYSYDEGGHQTAQIQYSWANNNWKGTSRTEWTYDAKGNKLSTISFKWLNNAWDNSSKEENIYDAQNRIIEKIVSSWQNGMWINSTRKTYVFDSRGQTITAKQYKWNVNQWTLISINDKTYDLLDNKLRREIAGTWSTTGIVQSYSDKHYFYSCDAPATNGSQPRTPTDIEEIDENNGTYENNENNAQPFDPTQPTYNLSGQRVDPGSYHGVVIQGDHTYLLP